MRVDRFHPSDLAGTYRVCLATGDRGADATHLHADPNLLGHLYVGPYVCLEPAYAFVLRDGDAVMGYALGALDTAAFEARCESRWWPPLRAMYPPGASRPATDDALVRVIHAPERTPGSRLATWPSHLHIDLLKAAQGRGYGRTMIEAVLDALDEAGSPGVHLGVARSNERAIGFYRHLGFERLDEERDTVIMGRVMEGSGS